MTIAKLSALTPAEQAVLDQALTGVTAREIAEHLSLSEATVRSHLSSIYVKLGVSGRVALLAQFRGHEPALPPAAEPAQPRPLGAKVAGWIWGILALFLGANAALQASVRLAYGGSPTDYLLTFGFAIACALTAILARAMLERPTAKLLTVSLWAAVGLLAFGIRAAFLEGSPELAYLICGAIGVAIGWISFRARREFLSLSRHS